MATDTPLSTARLVSFSVGDWLVEPRACRMSRGGTVQRLRPQLVDLLVCLARRQGEIVLKDEIRAEVWPGQFIAESGLSRCIAELRDAFEDDAQHPRVIETVFKRGYRLLAPVVWLAAAAETAAEHAEPGAGEPASPDLPSGSLPTAVPLARTRLRGLRPRTWTGIAPVMAALLGVLLFVTMARSPAPVLTERDVVLLAFENRTGDGVFDDTIPLAMSIQMEQSPYLALLSPGRIQDTLRMMKRPPDTPVTRAIGTEICERVGASVLIVTSLTPIGRQYAVGIEAVACGTGRVLARQQATAGRKEQVLDGLQRAATEIRRAVGEPATSLVRYNVPIVEATTSSLDALRALRRGDMAVVRGQGGLALELYREAISLDPDFALAYSRVGTLGEAHESERVAACEKAYALRGRVTLPERLEIEATYHRFLTGEQAKIIEALELLKQTYPRRASARRSLATEYELRGQYDAALAEAIQAQRLEPDSAASHGEVGVAYLLLDRIPEALANTERAIALGGGAPWLHIVLLECALASGDQALARRERAWAVERPELQPGMTLFEADESMSRGRVQEALGLLRQAVAWALRREDPELAAMWRLRMALFEALAGLRGPALAHVDDEVRRGLGRYSRIEAVKALAALGEFDRVERLLDDIEKDRGTRRPQPDATLVTAYRAAIDTSRNRADQALARLAPLEPYDLGMDYWFIPLLERARAYLVLGDWARARAAYEKMLAHPRVYWGRKFVLSAQLGLARTLARAGDVPASRRAYEQFFDRWKNADPDLPVLAEARREYQELGR